MIHSNQFPINSCHIQLLADRVVTYHNEMNILHLQCFVFFTDNYFYRTDLPKPVITQSRTGRLNRRLANSRFVADLNILTVYYNN